MKRLFRAKRHYSHSCECSCDDYLSEPRTRREFRFEPVGSEHALNELESPLLHSRRMDSDWNLKIRDALHRERTREDDAFSRIARRRFERICHSARCSECNYANKIGAHGKQTRNVSACIVTYVKERTVADLRGDRSLSISTVSTLVGGIDSLILFSAVHLALSGLSESWISRCEQHPPGKKKRHYCAPWDELLKGSNKVPRVF